MSGQFPNCRVLKRSILGLDLSGIGPAVCESSQPDGAFATARDINEIT